MPRKKRGFKTKKAPEKFAYGSDEESQEEIEDDGGLTDEIDRYHKNEELKINKANKDPFGGNDSALSSDEEDIPLESDSDEEDLDEEDATDDEEDDYQDLEDDGEIIPEEESENSDDDDEKKQSDSQSNDEAFDSDDDDTELRHNPHIIQAKKAEMDSDIEENSEDDGLPSAKAWGKKKSAYFGTDYVDKDFRRNKQEEEEAALAEEEEAKAIQKRLLEEIKESDLGLHRLPDIKERGEEPVQKIEVDVDSLTKREKLELLKKESPELSNLIEDFKASLAELERRKSLLNYTNVDDLESFRNCLPYRLYKVKFLLLTRYCMNISFYLTLKSKLTPVRNHPCVSSLVNLKKHLLELDKIENKKQVKDMINNFVEKIQNKSQIEMHFQPEEPSDNEIDLRDYDDERLDEPVQKKKKIRFADEMEDQQTNPEEDIELKQYGDLRENHDDEEDETDEDEDLDENLDEEDDDVEDSNLPRLTAEEDETEEEDEDEIVKRPINYQIAKNKGLTPKKKKEQRNPRVKHRVKYKKASARRKGQVRMPRKEVKKYSGEISGIRSSVVKSIKFK